MSNKLKLVTNMQIWFKRMIHGDAVALPKSNSKNSVIALPDSLYHEVSHNQRTVQ